MAEGNEGEKNEILLKLKLIDLRDKKALKIRGVLLNSVGFGGIEYQKFPNRTDLNSLIYYDYYKLKTFAEPLGISKSGGRSKSDVYINGIGYSVKYMSGAPPAIINHTPRPGFETACNHSNVDIKNLDDIISEYWELRESKKIGEDIGNSNDISPFKNHKDYLRDILNYFLFDGSGIGLANHRAEYILDYGNPLDTNTWKVYSKDNFIDIFWDRMIFSIRSKGMPSSYTPSSVNNYQIDAFGNSLVSDKKLSVDKWTKFSSGQYRGSLHVRIK